MLNFLFSSSQPINAVQRNVVRLFFWSHHVRTDVVHLFHRLNYGDL